MDLQIVNVHVKGDEDSEYVYLKVLSDCNLHYYAIADTSYTDDHHISNALRHFFWFPKKEVKAGDYVSLRTGKGKNIAITNDAGHKIHRFYWGLNEPVWNNDGDAAVLFQVNSWKTTRAI